MELHGQWDDEEQQLVIVEGNERASSSLTVTNPFGPEMVAVTSEMAGAEAPAQGSTTPKPVIAPEPTAQTPEMVSIPEPPPDGDQYQRTDIPERFSFEAIRESVNSMLAASDGNLVPPDVSSIQNVLGNFMGSTHFLSAPDVNNSLTQANSMLTPIFANVSDVERNKMMTELIINCIHKQKVLWDSTDPEFGNSKMCPLLWNNIASVCGMDVKKLRNKWNSLKKTFRKEYIKCITTGLTSKSPNFHAMSFLEGEIKRELQRESKEKVLVMQQLKKINGGNEPLDASGSSILHNLEAEEDDEYTSDPNDDDCMIVETVERLSVPSTSQARAVDTSTLPSQATSSKSDAGIQGLSQNAVSAPPTIRAKNILELQNKRPLGSESAQGSESSTSKNRSSPEVICLGDSKESQKPVKQYVAVPGKPIIKFSPSANSTVRSTIVVEAGMPKSLNEANLSVKVEEDSNLKPEPPAVIKQCARKSTSRANVKLFPWQNGARNAIAAPELNPVNTDKIPHPQGSSVMATESVKNDNEIQWKIQDARSIETGQTSMKQHVEPTRIGSIILSKQDCNRTSTITVLPKPRPVEAGQTSAKQQHIEPTRIRSSGNTPTAILPKPRSKEASQKYTKQNMEPTRSKSCSLSKPDSNTDSNETPTIAILPKPEPVDDDEIQIIKEVPGTSPHKGTTNQPITETRKRGTAEDPPAPPKRPRTSNGAECPPQRVAVKRKVDKDRENSANEHFLLSMLYDVETMSSEQFRRLKKHSTALASMILDPQ